MDRMRQGIFCISVCFLVMAGHADWCARERWFYFAGDLARESTAAKFGDTVNAAHEAGYNGVLLECNVGNAFLWDDCKVRKYRKILSSCASKGMKVIPSVWSVGYGSMLPYSPDLVETAPIRDLPYVVKNRHIKFAEEELSIDNAGLEDSAADGIFRGWETDAPGKVCFVDREVLHGGRQCIRLGPERTSEGHARLYRRISVKPFRCYRFSAWIRVDDACDDSLKKELRIVVRGGGEDLGFNKVMESPDFHHGQWRQYGVDFYTYTNCSVHVYVGAWGMTAARFWVDDLKIAGLPLSKVPRGAGSSFRVKRADTGMFCEEGRDYLPPPPMKDWRIRPNECPLTFEVPLGSSLKDGDRLLVDASIPSAAHIYDKSPFGQYSACMSDPALYEYFERSAVAVEEIFHPDFWMLSMDEIRAGGTCEACRARRTDMAHILGDCVTRQVQAIRKAHPKATVCMWSDMINPVHNAHDGYYSCRGTFHGSWNFIPKDVVVICWWLAKRNETLPFFEQLGFRTMAAAYYDAKNLDGCRDWMESCANTPHCLGLMYTTWRGDYGKMQAFGEMMKIEEKK